MSLTQFLFGFHGRINRRQYWLGNAGVGIAAAIIIFCTSLLFGSSKATLGLAWLAMPVVAIASSWVGFALQVKRFHDRGRSGYWVLAPILPVIMIVCSIFSGVASGAPPGAVVPEVLPWLGVLTLMNLWFLVDLGMLGSVEGPNKYGDTPGSPRAPTPQRPVAPSVALRGAEQAIERAIAQQAQTPVVRVAPTPAQSRAPSPAAASPASFGRRAAR